MTSESGYPSTARAVAVVGIAFLMTTSFTLFGAFIAPIAAAESPQTATNVDSVVQEQNESNQTEENRTQTATRVPPPGEIPEGGMAENFELVQHLPLNDSHQYVGNESFGIPRGSNGDITASGDCVYVGSFIGHQPPLVVDVSNPNNASVVGPVPNATPGVGNGIEGIEASGDLLVIDQRQALGSPELGFEVPEGMPARGLAIYDISDDCRNPELVARVDFGDLTTHTVSLWRDPQNSDRVLAIESFSDTPSIKAIDLTGCPEDCNPEEVANWDLGEQTGIESGTHEAIMSTDGNRLYVSNYQTGVLMLDSSNLMKSLREGVSCDPSAPTDTPGQRHCITLMNSDPSSIEDTAPPLSQEWHHTPIKVPGRPYLLEISESTGPGWDQENETQLTNNCPGALTRMIYIGEDEYAQDPDADDPATLLRGDLDPETIGVFGLPEQQLENCGPDGWKEDTSNLPAWFSPHDAVVFPDIAFVTYYGGGLRAVDISNPYNPIEVGHFFNQPVNEVRWASYGIQGETVSRTDSPLALRRPAPGQKHMFAFSYPLTHNGMVIYADVHSGLYILNYSGPHAEQVPQDGNCISGNPGAIEPGYEPCPDYGQTNWGTPGIEDVADETTANETTANETTANETTANETAM